MSKKKRQSPVGVLIAIILAIFVGSIVGKESALFGVTYYSIFELLGKLFINGLTLLALPLVFSSIITGVARIGSDASFGRLGLKTFGFYLSTSFLAILIGLILVNIINPGLSFSKTDVAIQAQTAQLQKISQADGGGLSKLLLDVVPSNIVQAFSQGNMLGIIFFSLLFGYAITKIESLASKTHITFWNGVFESMIYITHMIMKLLPIGVFCLVAKVFAETGLSSLTSVGLFTLAVLLGLGVFMFVALPLLLKFVGRVNPIRHFQAMGPALITAFSTSSSSASLPITLECAEKRAGVSNRICSLVIPLGTSLNLSGSALYEMVAALFVAQVYGLDLSLTQQLFFALVTLLTSMGVAGIPSGSLVGIIVILRTMGLPIEGIGLFIAVDRLLDMCRTTVNVFSDSVCAVLVARSEGETNILKSKNL